MDELHEVALAFPSAAAALVSEGAWRQCRSVAQFNERKDMLVLVSVLSKQEFMDTDAVGDAVDVLVQSLDEEKVAS